MIHQRLPRTVPAFDQTTMHSHDGAHFLGLRLDRMGRYEIVYDRQGAARAVLRLSGPNVAVERVRAAMAAALEGRNVLGGLYRSLADARIAIDVVS